jgi:hypothetical protein
VHPLPLLCNHGTASFANCASGAADAQAANHDLCMKLHPEIMRDLEGYATDVLTAFLPQMRLAMRTSRL